MTNEYLKNLPRKRMAAGVIILNEKDELLIVKTSYKDYWTLSGGVIEENESPAQGATREVKEEVGIDLKEIKFLCVDYNKADESKNKDESLQFMFYGGKLTDEEIKNIKIDNKEIVEYNFVPKEQAFELLGGLKRSLVRRIPKCLEAIKNNTGIYLEDGE